jgi:hypothetical protein
MTYEEARREVRKLLGPTADVEHVQKVPHAKLNLSALKPAPKVEPFPFRVLVTVNGKTSIAEAGTSWENVLEALKRKVSK